MVRYLLTLTILASACLRSPRDNHLSVSNPIPAGDLFPEVVQIIGYDFSGLDYLCSGVFIKPNLLLTAAHCTYSPQGDGLSKMTYTDADGVVHQGKMFPAPQYLSHREIDYNTRYDLAVISFDTDVAPAVAQPSRTAPISGETMTVVGFGETDRIFHGGIGTKNIGHNPIKSTVGNIITLTGVIHDRPTKPPGQDSLSGAGDSGGGIFNQRGELTGIASSVRPRLDQDSLGNQLGYSYFVNLSHPESAALFDDINANLCAGKSLKPGQRL